MQSSTYPGTDGASTPAAAAGRLSSLTEKQRAVLDLLIEFKTSKEISRILAISPHTVDQRVEAAKAKLGATSRADLALVYRELIGDPSIYERMTYEDFHIAPATIRPQQSSSVGTAFAPPNDPGSGNIAIPDIITEGEIRVVPEIFDGRWGTVARLAAIVAITALFCVAFLGGLAIFIQLSNLSRR